MAKKPEPTRRSPARTKKPLPDSTTLLADIRELIEASRSAVDQAVNSALVLLYWQAGSRFRAAHESPKTTKLYDRTQDQISLDEIERIAI